ncbi:MAG: GAF domain-containing protein, partial [Flammeovirgaceae bacterium]|nr:GAF domain-containing protein [Flammeovirgaceae bacterium]
MKVWLKIFLLATFLCKSIVYGQTLGRPFIQHFSLQDYKAHPQNFAALKDHRGFMYFGNIDGILEYDGSQWRCIKVPNEVTVRDLAIDSLGTIYVGCTGNFGFLNVEKNGDFRYVSLSDSLPEPERKFREVWEVFIHGENVYFRTNQQIFQVRNRRITNIWHTTSLFTTLFAYENQLFAITQEGIFVLQPHALVRTNIVADFSSFRFHRFKAVYLGKGVLLGTRKHGLRFFQVTPTGYELTPFETSIDLTKDIEVYGGVQTSDGFILYTINKGIFLFTHDGKFLRHFDKSCGLINNTVYDVALDDQGGIWCATANGINRISFPSPFSFWNDKDGIEETVTHITKFKGTFYIGTLGNFYRFSGEKAIPFFKETNPYIWNSINWKDQKLLISCSEGIFELQNDQLHLVDNSPSCFEMLFSRTVPEVLYVASTNGLLVSQLTRHGEYKKIGHFKEFADLRSLEQDDEGNLWIGTFRSGLYKVRFEKDAHTLKKIEKYDLSHGLPSLRNIHPYLVNDKIYIATERGLYEYDSTKNLFFPSPLLGSWHYELKKDIFSLKKDKNEKIWLSGLNTNKSPMLVAKKEDLDRQSNVYELHFSPFQLLPDMLLHDIYLDDEKVWIGGSQGLYVYDPKVFKEENKSLTVYFRKISARDTVFYNGNGIFTQDMFVFPYRTSITIQYALPDFSKRGGVLYRTSLSKNDEWEKGTVWNDWSSDMQKQFVNLIEGSYVFQVKAQNVYGQESQIATFRFKILPPFYRSTYAYWFYFVVILLLMVLFVRVNALRLKNLNQRLQAIIERKTHEVQEKNILLEQQKEELRSYADMLKKFNEELIKKGQELKQQSEEIQSQRDSIIEQKETLEKLNHNIQVLSEIGQQITSSLELKEIVRKVYDNVNKLLKAEGFGIGIYNPKLNRIEFGDFIEKGQHLPGNYDDLYDDYRLSVKCFKEEKTYVINDIERDFEKIVGRKPQVRVGEMPSSVIYMPLKVANKKIGVITVQSFERNAYSPHEVEMLKSLAAYIAIALLNSQAFHELQAQKEKLERARQHTGARGLLLSQAMMQVQDLITIIFLGIGLAVFSPWLLVILAVAVIPSFISETHFNERSYSLSMQWTPERRELDYYRYIAASDQTAKEIKSFDLADFFARRFKELSDNYYEANKRLA